MILIEPDTLKVGHHGCIAGPQTRREFHALRLGSARVEHAGDPVGRLRASQRIGRRVRQPLAALQWRSVPVAPRIRDHHRVHASHDERCGAVGRGRAVALEPGELVRGASRVRRMALASFVFLITEALLGAGLVLFNYVDKDAVRGAEHFIFRCIW